MTRFLIKRIALLVPVVFGIITATFLLMHATPGDPALTYLGNHPEPAAIAALHHQWGLDKPVTQQYLDFIGGLFTGDLGNSLFYNETIVKLISLKLPPTLMLMIMGSLFGIIFALPLAIWTAIRKDKFIDHLVSLLNAVILGMPIFFIGAMGILFLALKVQIFPVGGYGETNLQHLWSLVLPSLTIGLGLVPLLVRSLRTSVIESLDSEYVAFARSKGLKNRSVWLKYALRNGSISGISILGIQVGYLAGGSLVIENVFGIPGMGSFLMTGILNRDFPVIQGATLTFAMLVVLVYLLTDVSYALLDPRARFK
jgi:peptide/nickel transport system permease protein